MVGLDIFSTLDPDFLSSSNATPKTGPVTYPESKTCKETLSPRRDFSDRPIPLISSL
jgi:hypothetical protein